MAIDVFAGMNERQCEAVRHLRGPLSVIAGAGSGKTRVITHRIAHIIDQGTRPDRILAITFTNKAAGEMQERVERLLGLKTPWITTFHSAGLRILKLEHDKLGLAHPFTIIDPDDRKRMFKRILKDLDLDPAVVDPRQLEWQVGHWKNNLQRPKEVAKFKNIDPDTLRVYQRYVDLCREECVLDFDDLLLQPVMLMREDEELRQRYEDRFPYILIDEYQDTNKAQYELIRLLGRHGNVCATGDPDQAIYGWRGADLRNILRFEQDFPGCKTVLLEQNYRSTQTILRAAQAVVEHNEQRKDKTIFTDNDRGSPITLISVDDQDDEAMAVAAAIDRLRGEGRELREMAIFYRINAQSRTIEEWLMRRGIPYRIVGGTRFYDRREVRDLLAYCKLLINPRDLASFHRIVNVPRRGIGEKTLATLREVAYDEGVSIHDVLMSDHLLDQVAVGRAARPLRGFATLLRRLHKLDQSDPGDCVRRVLQLTELEDFFLTHDEEQGPERVANLGELVTAAEQYEGIGEQGGMEGFLDHVSLLTSADDRRQQDQDQVLLMTLHASKGLEFPVVFITGCEQGVLPLVRQNQPCDYEEERRLMYVGITRAMEHLYLARAVTRLQFGQTVRNSPSMFLGEMPDDCLIHIDKTGFATRSRYDDLEWGEGPSFPSNSAAYQTLETRPPAYADIDSAMQDGALMRGSALRQAVKARGSSSGAKAIDKPADLAVGDRVSHATFGRGVIASMQQDGDDDLVEIDFDDHGPKELILQYALAKMKKLSQS